MAKQRMRLVAVLALVAMVAAACTTGEDVSDPLGDDESPAGDDERVNGGLIVGTTDIVASLDPARVSDFFSSHILSNVGETLVGFEPGETEVTPRLAADVQISDDGLVYTFSLREDVTFHDGSSLDSEDVRFSLECAVTISHAQGVAFLLAGADRIEIPDERTVVVTLTEANVTFLSRLAHPVATIVPSDGADTTPDAPVEGDDEAAEQGAEKCVNDDLVATGPYRLTEFQADESITLEAFEDYWGVAPATERVRIQFFETSSQLQFALESGAVDIAVGGLSPGERQDLEDADGIQTVEGEGTFVRYLVFNTLLEPVDDVNVRKAVAAAIDRERVVEEVFAGTAEPLYSLIPPSVEESATPLAADEEQDPATLLEGLETPVRIDLFYGGELDGPTEASLARVVERSLEETGLFEVNLTVTERDQFTAEAWRDGNGRYPAFLLGRYPDYDDPDAYIAPFFASSGVLGFFDHPQIEELIAAEQQVPDASSEERQEMFERIQRIVADDALIVPLVVQTPAVFASEDVSGLAEVMDPARTLRYRLLAKE